MHFVSMYYTYFFPGSPKQVDIKGVPLFSVDFGDKILAQMIATVTKPLSMFWLWGHTNALIDSIIFYLAYVILYTCA